MVAQAKISAKHAQLGVRWLRLPARRISVQILEAPGILAPAVYSKDDSGTHQLDERA